MYEFSYCLRAVRKIFWHFGGAKASKRLSKLQYKSKKEFWKIWFLKKKLSQFFRVLIKNFADFCQKIFSNRKIFNEVIFFLEKKHVFPRKLREKFLVFVRNFRQVGQDCTLCVRMRFLSELFYLWIFWVFYCFPTVGRTFFNIGAKVLEKLSKVHSTWTTKLFEESLFFEESIYFYNFFEFWWKTRRTSVGKPSAGFEKLLSTLVQGIFLQHNIIIFLQKIYAY